MQIKARSLWLVTVASNDGTTRTNWKGIFPGFGEVWYDLQAITNILSLKAVQEKYRIHYDSEMGNTFVVDMGPNSMTKFYQSTEGLYYYDTANTKNENGVTFINTVASNKSRYSNDDFSCAVTARKIQALIGRPLLRDYIDFIKKGLLPNCPVEDIFRTKVGCLKGKTVRKPSKLQRTKMAFRQAWRYGDIA
jgi:hypothetical protein